MQLRHRVETPQPNEIEQTLQPLAGDAQGVLRGEVAGGEDGLERGAEVGFEGGDVRAAGFRVDVRGALAALVVRARPGGVGGWGRGGGGEGGDGGAEGEVAEGGAGLVEGVGAGAVDDGGDGGVGGGGGVGVGGTGVRGGRGCAVVFWGWEIGGRSGGGCGLLMRLLVMLFFVPAVVVGRCWRIVAHVFFGAAVVDDAL